MGGPGSEARRQWIHFSMVGFCLLLRFLGKWEAAGVAALAVAFNCLVLPRLRFGRDIVREKEPFLSGVRFYPIAVLLVIVLFPMPIAAAAWGVLASGDCFSNVLGRAYGRRRLPWNPKKSVVGSLTFVITAFPAAWFFGWWAALGHPEEGYGTALLAAIAATGAVAGAIIESLPIRIDDNLSVTLGSALAMFAAALMTTHVSDLAIALGVNACVAAVALLTRTVSRSGAAAGLAVGTLVYIGVDWRGYALLVAFFIAGSLATKHRYAEKAARGIEEKRGGARGARNALAKGVVAVACAVLHLVTGHPLFVIGYASAIATALADTTSSELGKVYGKHPVLITTLRRVPPGTEGAVSVEGTLLGIAASAAIAALALALGVVDAWPAAGIVVAAAFVGTTVESVLGAAVQGLRGMSNEVVNVFLTLVGAGVGIGLRAIL
jgi:uncharacterized protein (TIGR00297 family)